MPKKIKTMKGIFSMNIARIDIKNFGCIYNLTVWPSSNRIVVFGENGAGKSSIARALQMALYGRCAWTAKNGNGAISLIRDNATHATVSISIDEWSITLTIRRNGTKKVEWEILNESTGETCDTMDQWWRLMEINPEHAVVAGMPDAYLLGPDIGDVMADIACPSVPVNDVLKLCGVHAQWVRSQLKGVVSRQQLDNFGLQCFDDRRLLKKQREDVKRIVEEIGFVAPVKNINGKALQVSDLPSIEIGVNASKKKLQSLIEERGAAANALTPEQRAAIQSEIDAINCAALAEKKSAAIIDEQNADARFGAVHNALADAKSELSQSEKLLADIERNPQCPTCMRFYDERQYEKTLCDARERKAVALEKSAAISAEYNAAKSCADIAKQAVAAAREAHANAYAKTCELMARISIANNVRPVETIQKEIDETEAKIARGEKIIEQLRRAQSLEVNTTRLAELNDEISRLDWACESFKDGAIQKQIMLSGLEDFTTRANAELLRFGYRLGVLVDGKTVSATMNNRPVSRCSRGQQLLAQFAIAAGFAAHKAPMIIDNINDLDEKNRDLLFSRIEKISQPIIVMGAYVEDFPTFTNATTIKMEGGFTNE